jgi:hypothetical protein
MPKAGFSVARVCFLMLAASMLGAGMLVAPAAAAKVTCASSAGKCFAVTVTLASPPPPAPFTASTPPAGGTVAFAFKVTNEASTQQVGSFQITAPASFVITGASVPSPGTASFMSSSALFTNLSVAPSASITVIVTAVLPCSDNSYKWGMTVKQSNDFSGLPGNDFSPDSAVDGNLSGMPSGSCSLAFTAKPASTTVNNRILAGFDSQGGAVEVQVLDASGQLITNSAATSSTAPVTVQIDSQANPGDGSLSGTTTENASGGIASFSDLTINNPGIGYALTASSPGITSTLPPKVPADFFTIWGSLNGCHGNSCSASASSSSKTTTGTVATSSATSTEVLGASFGGISYNCPGTYDPVTDPFSFDLFSSGVAQAGTKFSTTLDISKSLVQSSGRNNPSAWEICYASTSPFATLSGPNGTTAIGGVPYYTGLLPDCPSAPVAPCVQARGKSGGDVILTVIAFGDPVYKG